MDFLPFDPLGLEEKAGRNEEEGERKEEGALDTMRREEEIDCFVCMDV